MSGAYKRARNLSAVGLGVGALMLATVATGPADASSRHTPTPALSMTHHKAGAVPAVIDKKRGKCHTNFGTPISPDPDGIISWNDLSGSGIDTAGAADFKCGKRHRTIRSVTVNGYFGDAGSTQFNVTVYSNMSGEPDNGSAPVCATQTVTGTPTGSSYPTNDTTVITLSTPCLAKRGTNWIEVQAVTSSGIPWYWETQQEVDGSFPADWRDATGAFGTGCTPGYQDGLYMQDCIFGGDIGENDFMFRLD